MKKVLLFLSTSLCISLTLNAQTYCDTSGFGNYYASPVTTTGGTTNINYTGNKPANGYELTNAELIILLVKTQLIYC